jgi:hypothetical protein
MSAHPAKSELTIGIINGKLEYIEVSDAKKYLRSGKSKEQRLTWKIYCSALLFVIENILFISLDCE